MRARAASAPICWRTALSSMAGRPPRLCPPGHLHEAGHRIEASPGAPHARALLGQAGSGHPPALPRCPDHVGRRDVHLVEEHLVEVGGARHLAQGTDVDTRAAHVEDEGGDAGRAVHRLRACQQVAVVGPLGPRAPHLLAHHDEVTSVPDGPGLQRGEVAPGVGLAEELGPDVVAPCDGWQMGDPLLVGAEMLERPGDERVAEHVGNAGRPELLLEDALLVRIAALGREAVEPVAGVVQRARVGAQPLHVGCAVGHAQAGALLPLQRRLVLGDEGTQRGAVLVVLGRDGWDDHVHGLTRPPLASRRPRTGW